MRVFISFSDRRWRLLEQEPGARREPENNNMAGDDKYKAFMWVGRDERGGRFCTGKSPFAKGANPLVSHLRHKVDSPAIERQMQAHADAHGIEIRLVELNEADVLKVVRPRRGRT